MHTSCTSFYLGDEIEWITCDTFYYENGIRKSLNNPDKVETFLVEKGDSVFHYLDSRLEYLFVNGYKVIAYCYDEDKNPTEIHNYFYNTIGEPSQTLIKNPKGELIKTVNRIYFGSLLLKIEVNDLQSGKKSCTYFEYTYYE